MVKKEWLLAFAAVVLTTVVSLLLVRWLAPQLLGVPVDLQLVQTSKAVPPFYEGVFREQDFAADGMLLNDPYTNTRFKPLLAADAGTGPHDILGFRNTAVPNTAEVIVIGDSQTYGIGEALADNWPSQLQELLTARNWSVYSMAVGGWGAVQYFDMFSKAARLKPEVVIIAFYSGNDPLEAFSTAYGNAHWHELRLDLELDKADAPAAIPMLALEDAWRVTFSNGIKLAFTPRGRLVVNNRKHAAVRTGYAIMAEVARRIAAMATAENITAVFTVIPTRELVYARRVAEQQLAAPETYTTLVTMEQENIDELAGHIRELPGAHYVDLLQPLQSAALTDSVLYPRQWDGHPGQSGYRVIATTLANAIKE
jgi:lysophospholipase L1-like esterase